MRSWMVHRYVGWAFLLTAMGPPLAAGDAPWWPQAPRLPAPAGQVLTVATVEELYRAAEEIAPGGTILLEDGLYRMPRYFELRTDHVTLRGASGNRDRVVLDATESQHGELVGISRCRGVTIADLTIQNVKWNGFKINSNLFATHVTIRNCVIRNVWQRGVKGPAVDPRDRATFQPENCVIEYCLFTNDRPKQYADDPTDTAENFGGNYVGGIDAMHAKGWIIRDNVFVGIKGRTGEGRGAVFLWNESRDCVVERNVVIDCDSGICLGNYYRAEGTRWHAHSCLVRNNFVVRCEENGILAARTRDCRIVHNTIHHPTSRLGRLIWALEDNDGLLVANNLLDGPDVLVTASGTITRHDNLSGGRWGDYFADARGGNLRLVQPLPVNCPRLPHVPDDIDRRPLPEPACPGAHQWVDAPSPEHLSAESAEVAAAAPWVETMKRVHAGFDGSRGYVAQLGDSITHSMAFWSPMGWDPPDQYLLDDDGLPKTPRAARWRDVILGTRDKGPSHGNYSGWRIEQLLACVDDILANQQPEMALIMVGTNDISGNRVPAAFGDQLAQLVQRCLDAHCIPILSTIPPRRDHDQAVEQVNQRIRDLASRLQIPLVDYHREVLRRRPGNSWDGTLISDDGVHPSGGETHVYTAENLRQCGYALRNWASFLVVRQVYFRVLRPEETE